MRRILSTATAVSLALCAVSASAQVPPYPGAFRTQEISANGAMIHVRVGGSGPAVVLLHGYGETGDMWAPMAAELMRDHTVIVPDLRGLGRSSHPAGGFAKMNQAEDVAGVLDPLKVDRADIVAHDIGNMVAFAFAEKHPERVGKMVLIDAPVPGIGPWEEIVQSPLLWHFRFGGPDMERLVKGRERSISTASGTISPPIPGISRRPRESITPSSTRCPAQCTPASSSSTPSIRTRSTIAPGSRGTAS